MKCIIISVIMFLAVSVQAIEVKTIFDVPNIRACSSYDFTNNATGVGMESTLLRYKSLDLAVGYLKVSEKYSGTAALEINLDKLNLPGLEYAWKDFVHSSVGLWVGYSIADKAWNFGVNASLISWE